MRIKYSCLRFEHVRLPAQRSSIGPKLLYTLRHGVSSASDHMAAHTSAVGLDWAASLQSKQHHQYICSWLLVLECYTVRYIRHAHLQRCCWGSTDLLWHAYCRLQSGTE